MGNIEIARLLRKIAAAYTILGENRFKIIAYDNAATAVEHATSELKDLWEDGKLDSVPGLGASIREHLDELFKTGKSKHFEQVLKKVNPAVFPLLDVPGLGPKRAEILVESLKLKEKSPVDELEKAAKEHKIAKIEGFGEKSELDILTNIERYRHGAIKEKRMVLPEADELAEEIISYISKKAEPQVGRIDKLGSLRRRVATIGDVDLAVATEYPEEVIKAFVAYPGASGLVEKGPTGASILLSAGRQADLRVAKPEEYGAMLQYFTGSKYHNIKLRDFALKKGLSLSEYGTKELKSGKIHRFKTEEEFYKFLGMDWIPPELREDTDEIEAALKHKLPKLVELKDIKGDLQMHSSDLEETSHDSGEDSVKVMREIGEKLGYGYIGISDHNPSQAKNSPKEMEERLHKRNELIDHINYSTKGCRVIKLLEVDILPSGELPVPQEALDGLDGCLVSIHSSFNMNKAEMTGRVLKGLSNPVARILAHPTGRLLGAREGYELDWDQIFSFCLEHDKALEINAYPNRLDLPDTLVREAVKRGVKLSLGTDAHNKDGLLMMPYGIAVARRGWAEAKNIVNTLDYREIISWLHKRT
ncbi:DNA polymerase/3'-5' exonuclease PolX [Patescibacteria group bacterium]|nr:DNA polymerase/3'-5' exonuclease PolX [Patescibacteria group bacterium]